MVIMLFLIGAFGTTASQLDGFSPKVRACLHGTPGLLFLLKDMQVRFTDDPKPPVAVTVSVPVCLRTLACVMHRAGHLSRLHPTFCLI